VRTGAAVTLERPRPLGRPAGPVDEDARLQPVVHTPPPRLIQMNGDNQELPYPRPLPSGPLVEGAGPVLVTPPPAAPVAPPPSVIASTPGTPMTVTVPGPACETECVTPVCEEGSLLGCFGWGCGPRHRFYARGEYLLWWIRDSNTPQLVTTGS